MKKKNILLKIISKITNAYLTKRFVHKTIKLWKNGKFRNKV